MIAQTMVLLNGNRVLCRADTDLVEPLGLDVETARAVLHDLAVPVLPLAAEKPIDEYFRRIRVGRILDNTNDAEGITRRQSFFWRRHRLDRQTGVDKRIGLTAPKAERHRNIAFR